VLVAQDYVQNGLPDDVQKIFSAARAERMAPSGADGFFEGEAREKRQLARQKSAPSRARSGSLSAVA